MFRKLFFLLLIISTYISAFSQRTITGKVLDAQTHEVLPFANILKSRTQGVITNAEGFFSIELPDAIKTLTISYIGFEKQILHIQPDKDFYLIALQPAVENLETVEITGKYVNPAIALLKKIVEKKSENDYRKKISKYSYIKHFKFLVTANPDSIDATLDTVFYNGKFKKVDSSLFEFKKEVTDKDLYIMESVMKINVQHAIEKNKIIATRTAGFKNPMYELVALQASNFHVYDDEYKFLIKKYLGPLTKLSLKQYQYELEDTIQIQERTVYVLSYINTKKPLISGKIYVDTQSLAIAKMSINTYKQFELQMIHNFKYYPENDIWFPDSTEMFIRKAKKNRSISLAGGAILLETRKEIDTVQHSNNNRVFDYLFATSKMKYSKIQFGKLHQDKIKYNVQIAPDASRKKEEFWEQYTDTFRREREKNTYKFIDSLSEKEEIESKIDMLRKASKGYIPQKWIDIDMVHLLDKNQYEGLRISLGGKTNEKISNLWELSSYVAYGFKDKAFKYAGKIRYKLNHETQTYLHFGYTKDLQASASFTPYRSESLSGLFAEMSYEKYYLQNRFQGGISHLLSEHLKTNLNISTEKITRKYPLRTIGSIEFPEMDLTGINFQLEYLPFTKFFLSSTGREVLDAGYPKFYLNFEKTLPKYQSSTRDFIRLDVQAVYKKKHLNKDETGLLVQVGYASKEAGITHIYSPVSNGYDISNSKWYNQLHLRMLPAFETIQHLEFADNFVTTMELNHNFAKLRLGKERHFDVKVIARAAWGLSYNTSNYLGVKSLDKGFIETGVELNRLYKVFGQGFGVGFYYRMGAYAYDNTWDNVSVKLTFDASELFK